MTPRRNERTRTSRMVEIAGIAASAALLACSASGCYTRLASIHPATDITRVTPDGDEVYGPRDTIDLLDRGYGDPRAFGNYPEDRFYDPYAIGFTYSDSYDRGRSYYGGGSGYRNYYEDAWWLDPRYSHGHSGGGSFGSSGSGVPAVDTTKTRVAGGRRLWTTPDQTPPGAVPPAVSYDSPPTTSGGGATPPAGAGADTTKVTPKKGAGRRLWR